MSYVQLPLPLLKTKRTWEDDIRERYPITEFEKAMVPEGVRLVRFVPRTECEKCQLAVEDHILWSAGPDPQGAFIKVCLKDLRSRDGIKTGNCQTR